MPKRLLVIDPIPTHRIRLKAALRAAQYDIVSVDRIACAAGVMEAGHIDLILVNTSGTDPAKMMTRLRQALGATVVPVLCRDDEAGPARRMSALATGARDMVATRVPEMLLLARLRGLLRESETAMELEHRRVAAASFGFSEAAMPFGAQGRVLRVALETAEESPVLEDFRGSELPFQVSALSREELLRDDKAGQSPDAIVLQAGRDEMGMLDRILPEIRMRSHLRQASVLVLHDPESPEVAVRALNLGAAEIAEEGSSTVELTHRIDMMLSRKLVRDALRRSTEESFRIAATDVLTGLYNRRYAEVYLADVLHRAGEGGRGFTVMMADIDHFKAVNDTFGHGAGDGVLKEVSRRIRDNLRAVDLVSRHGGEEFLVILPEIDGVEAEMAAERLRKAVAGTPVPLETGVQIEVTVSIGVTVAPAASLRRTVVSGAGAQADDAKEALTRRLMRELLESADRALYEAKNSGRNCISVSSSIASAA